MFAPDDTPSLADLIPLRTLAAQLPRRRAGKKTHVAAVYRLTERGLHGVRLRFVQVGDTRCSTLAWVNEFFAALTARSESANAPAAPASRTPASRRKAVEAADRELEKLAGRSPVGARFEKRYTE